MKTANGMDEEEEKEERGGGEKNDEEGQQIVKKRQAIANAFVFEDSGMCHELITVESRYNGSQGTNNIYPL